MARMEKRQEKAAKKLLRKENKDSGEPTAEGDDLIESLDAAEDAETGVDGVDAVDGQAPAESGH
jgi:hypothetical protein